MINYNPNLVFDSKDFTQLEFEVEHGESISFPVDERLVQSLLLMMHYLEEERNQLQDTVANLQAEHWL